jgi:hypothetical protein
MMRRLYHILALIGLINLFAVGGLAGFLFISGRLNAQRVDQIGVVLRGEFPTSQPATTQPAQAAARPEPSKAEIARMAAQREYFELVAKRHEREMNDKHSLNQEIQLQVQQEREEIEKKKAEFEAQRKKVLEQSQQDGFARTLELYSTMDPNKAKDLLRSPANTKDADVVQLLMQMDASRAKKIVNACKTPEELAWIGRILNQINNVNQAGGGVDGPKPSSTGG